MCLKRLLYPDYDKLKAELEAMSKENNRLLLELGDLNSELSVTKQKLIDLEVDYELEKIAETFDNNYPKAEVFYSGRTLPNYPDTFACDVRLMVTPQDYSILKIVKDNNLRISNPLLCNSEILKIYKFCRLGSVYNYDNTLFQRGEVWLFPFEFMYLKKNGDCEDNSHYIVSILRAAGLPAFRIRVVVGSCKLGGHSTVYVLGDNLKDWYHINSTGGHEDLTDLTQFPTSKQTTTDDLGIADVWFSFNDKFSWSTFKTESAKESFDRESKDIIIHRYL
jgi:hypothetical protein